MKLLEVKFVLQSPTFVYEFVFEKDNGMKKSITVLYSPTGNCQFFSIRYFYNFIKFGQYDFTKKESIFILQTICSKIKKKMILIDINEDLYEKLNIFFDENDIVLNQSYISTNNSKMRMMLLRVDKYIIQK